MPMTCQQFFLSKCDLTLTYIVYHQDAVRHLHFLSLAEEGNSSCRNVQHNILASVNFLYIFFRYFVINPVNICQTRKLQLNDSDCSVEINNRSGYCQVEPFSNRFEARFIRRISAVSNAVETIDNEMLCFIQSHACLFELHSTRQKCDIWPGPDCALKCKILIITVSKLRQAPGIAWMI